MIHEEEENTSLNQEVKADFAQQEEVELDDVIEALAESDDDFADFEFDDEDEIDEDDFDEDDLDETDQNEKLEAAAAEESGQNSDLDSEPIDSTSPYVQREEIRDDRPGGERPERRQNDRGDRENRSFGDRERPFDPNRDAYEARETARQEKWVGVDKFKINSAASRAAESFDDFRRNLIKKGSAASGPIRAAWFGRLAALAEEVFGQAEMKLRKPGIVTRLFSVEVALPWAYPEHLEEFRGKLDAAWLTLLPPGVQSETCFYFDRKDAYWEFAVETEAGYVTGAVKLRTATFANEQRNGGGRGGRDTRDQGGDRRGYGDRPYQDRGDRPFRPRPEGGGGGYQDRGDRPYRPRPEGGGGYQDRGDRPYRPRPEGGGGGYQDRGDRPYRPRPEGGGGGYQDRGDRPYRPRPEGGGGGYQDRGDRPYRPRPEGGGGYQGRNDGPKPWQNRDRGTEGPTSGSGPDAPRGDGPPPRKRPSPPDWVKKKKGH